MRNTFVFSFLLFSLIASTGCKKEGTTQTDVYVAGRTYTASGYKAVYWKNGEKHELTDGTQYAEAKCIYVKGTDTYVAGVIAKGSYGSNIQAAYWKNGKPTLITDGSNSAEVTSLFVSGNDVYVAGRERYLFKYWKNGKETGAPFQNKMTFVNNRCNSIIEELQKAHAA